MLQIARLIGSLVVLAPAVMVSDVLPFEARPVVVRATVDRQAYCSGDVESFSVHLYFTVAVNNVSAAEVGFPSDMSVWTVKVAKSIESARAGTFMYELTWTRMHQSDAPGPGKTVWVKPGSTAQFKTSYGLVARYHAAADIPSTLVAGSYALVLVFAPDVEPRGGSSDPRVLTRFTSAPVVLNVPRDVKVKDCGSGK